MEKLIIITVRVFVSFYLSGPVVWRNGGRWQRPVGWSPSLALVCCWEENWLEGTSPSGASATGEHTHAVAN